MQAKKTIAITYTSPVNQAKAHQLAKFLNLPLFEKANQFYDFLLIVNENYLALQSTTHHSKPFWIDFQTGKLRYRYEQIHYKKELLATALGYKPHQKACIVDATAGLGQDSFILSALGFSIIAIERSLILYVLLQDALSRAAKHEQLVPCINRLQLIHSDSITWLKNHADQKLDVIYLDPMFPVRKKSALVKKEMVILQDLLGKDSDTEQLFEMALTCAANRVVVKRPRLSNALGDKKPDFSKIGRSSRFDIYLV